MGVTVTIGKDSDGNYYATVDDESTTSTYTTTDYDLVANKTTTISSYTFSNSVTNAYISDKKHYYNTSSTIEQSDSISNVNNISTISYYYNDLEYVFNTVCFSYTPGYVFLNCTKTTQYGEPIEDQLQQTYIEYVTEGSNTEYTFYNYDSLAVQGTVVYNSDENSYTASYSSGSSGNGTKNFQNIAIIANLAIGDNFFGGENKDSSVVKAMYAMIQSVIDNT